MKLIIILLSGILFFCLGFYVDYLFVNYCISVLPSSINEYFGIIKIGLYVFTFGFTLSISILLGSIGVKLVDSILD